MRPARNIACSPDGAQRNPGAPIPHFAALHAGYTLCFFPRRILAFRTSGAARRWVSGRRAVCLRRSSAIDECTCATLPMRQEHVAENPRQRLEVRNRHLDQIVGLAGQRIGFLHLLESARRAAGSAWRCRANAPPGSRGRRPAPSSPSASTTAWPDSSRSRRPPPAPLAGASIATPTARPDPRARCWSAGRPPAAPGAT